MKILQNPACPGIRTAYSYHLDRHQDCGAVRCCFEFHRHRYSTGCDLHHHRRQNRQRCGRTDCCFLLNAVWSAALCNADSGRCEKRKMPDSGLRV